MTLDVSSTPLTWANCKFYHAALRMGLEVPCKPINSECNPKDAAQCLMPIPTNLVPRRPPRPPL